ncbi:MAG TPA: hypothetical protein VJZ27_12345, partial [Aggregatilineales bacterium]|nr:hypothetical protein [Aggregatilineales bacterium]
PDALASRMLALLKDPVMRDTMGRAAHTIAQEYSWSKIVDQLLEVFTMLGTRPRILPPRKPPHDSEPGAEA